MVAKEYNIRVHENGVVEWKRDDGCDIHTTMMGFREIIRKREETKAPKLGKTARETGDWKPCGKCGSETCNMVRDSANATHICGKVIQRHYTFCEYHKSDKCCADPVRCKEDIAFRTKKIISDIHWQKCNMCDSTVCRKKHKCKEEVTYREGEE